MPWPLSDNLYIILYASLKLNPCTTLRVSSYVSKTTLEPTTNSFTITIQLKTHQSDLLQLVIRLVRSYGYVGPNFDITSKELRFHAKS